MNGPENQREPDLDAIKESLPSKDCDPRIVAIQNLSMVELKEKIEAARSMLKERSARTDTINQTILMSGRLAHLSKEIAARTTTAEDAGVEKNRIAFALENFLNENDLPDILTQF